MAQNAAVDEAECTLLSVPADGAPVPQEGTPGSPRVSVVLASAVFLVFLLAIAAAAVVRSIAAGPATRALQPGAAGVDQVLSAAAQVVAGSLRGGSTARADDPPCHGGTVPFVVYVTSNSEELSGPLADLWDRNLAYLPEGTTIRYFNETQRALSVQAISAEMEAAGVVAGAYEAYRNLRPGAYLADIWRQMVLWQHGGIYMDCKLELSRKLTDWMDVCGSTGPAMWIAMDGFPGDLLNGIIAATAKNDNLAKIIRFIVDQVANHTYFDGKWRGPWMLTGPGALGRALDVRGVGPRFEWNVTAFGNETVGSPRVPRICGRWAGPERITARLADGTEQVVAFSNETVRFDTRYQAKLTYRDFYHLHQVYCDEPGPPCPQLP